MAVLQKKRKRDSAQDNVAPYVSKMPILTRSWSRICHESLAAFCWRFILQQEVLINKLFVCAVSFCPGAAICFTLPLFRLFRLFGRCRSSRLKFSVELGAAETWIPRLNFVLAWGLRRQEKLDALVHVWVEGSNVLKREHQKRKEENSWTAKSSGGAWG